VITASGAIAIMVLLLSSDGYWIGGREVSIQGRWFAAEAARPATLHWRLVTATAELVRGQVAVPADDQDVKITLIPPTVRARVDLTLDWTLVDEQGQRLDGGRQTVHLFPDDLLASLPRLVGKRRVVVVDRPDGIPALLAQSGVEHQRVESLMEASGLRAEILLIGQDRWPTDAWAESVLRQVVADEYAVAIFAQNSRLLSRSIAGNRLVNRLAPHHLAYRGDLPLFAGLDRGMIASWFAAQPRATWSALRLLKDSAATPLALWGPLAQDADSRDAAAAMMMLENRTVLLWQIPMPQWQGDPRSELLLMNVIDALVAPPVADRAIQTSAWKWAPAAPLLPVDLSAIELLGDRP
jgi:hypothetical protein